jgi:dUTP pyrophosphatase
MIGLTVEKNEECLEVEALTGQSFDLVTQWEFDAGIDIRACIRTPLILEPLSYLVIPTGLHFQLSEHRYEVQVRSRSGLAAKQGIFVLNSPGTVDYLYREEVKVILFNLGKNAFTINPADRIAQICVREVPQFVINYGKVNSTGRGGLGSTGVQ